MPRQIIEPIEDEHGSDVHPAFGMIGASRVQSTGTTLVDSDVRHQHYVVLRLHEATRSRDLNRDHWMARKPIVEIALSEAQWASFVSSMNAGDGTPCTIQYRQGEGHVPGLPYAPRLALSMAEVRGAAEKTLQAIQEAYDAYEEKKNADNLRTLKYAIANAVSNIDFTARKLSEHAENVVQRSRADIEAFVVSKAKQLGLDPGEMDGLPMLTEGDVE